jgi:hypothetical protein
MVTVHDRRICRALDFRQHAVMRDWSETSKGHVDLDQHAGLVTVDWKTSSGAADFEENLRMVTVEGRMIHRAVEGEHETVVRRAIHRPNGTGDVDWHDGPVTVDWKMSSGAADFEENSWMVIVEGRMSSGAAEWGENSYPGIPEIGS